MMKLSLGFMLLFLVNIPCPGQSTIPDTVFTSKSDSVVFIDPTGYYHIGPFTPENASEPTGNQGDIYIHYLGGNRIAICLGYVSHGPAFNVGYFADTLSYSDNWAEYHCPYSFSDCVVRFAFSEKGVNVRQIQNSEYGCCTFGNNVYVDGYYGKQNCEVPVINEQCTGE